jgi:CHAT domain-containing protein/tetratricopeptide (TPR) repeat protein
MIANNLSAVIRIWLPPTVRPGISCLILVLALASGASADPDADALRAGIEAHARGEYHAAFVAFTTRLAQRPSARIPDDTELSFFEWTARSLFDSGSHYQALDALDAGLSRASLARAVEPSSPQRRSLLASRGAVLLAFGRYDDAVVAFDEALAGAEDVEEAAQLHFQAGAAHAEAGRARRALEAAIHFAGDDSDLAASAWQNLALVSSAEGDVDRGISELTRALAAGSRLPPVDRAVIHFNRGLLRDQKALTNAAVEDYNRAIEILRRDGKPGHPVFVRIFVSLAAAQARRGDRAAADQSLRDAEAAARRGASGADRALILEFRAMERASAGALPDARRLMDSCLALSIDALGPKHDRTLSRLRLAAGIDSELGDSRGAIAKFDSYVEGMEDFFRRLDWKKAPIYAEYVAAVRAWCAWLRSLGPSGVEKAMEYEERVAGVRARSMAIAAASPEEQAEYALVRDADARAERVRTRVAEGAADARELREALNEAGQAWEGFLRHHRGIRIRVPDLRTIRRHLGETEVFIRFAVSESSTVAYVVSRDGIRITENRLLGRRALKARVVEFADAMHRVDSPPSAADCESLFRDLFGELSSEVRSYRRLFLLPDGMLYHLPFDALDPDSNGAYRPWVADATIEILPNLQRATPPPLDAETTLIYAAPSGAGPALPAAMAEGRAVSRFAAPALLRTGDSASELGLRRDLSSPFRALHFACHALARGIRAEELMEREAYIDDIMVSNHLRLAPAPPDGDPSEADGRLTLRELRSLDPDVAPELVVLSACQTAMGEAEEGLEVLSVADAFHSIGVRHLVATLWPIYDRSAMKLFSEFYRIRSEGVPDGLALAEAKRLLAASPDLNHPVHWSGIVFYRPGW